MVLFLPLTHIQDISRSLCNHCMHPPLKRKYFSFSKKFFRDDKYIMVVNKGEYIHE